MVYLRGYESLKTSIRTIHSRHLNQEDAPLCHESTRASMYSASEFICYTVPCYRIEIRHRPDRAVIYYAASITEVSYQ